MSVAAADQSIPTPATAGPGVLEVDAFCAGCHYNLHGQVVTVDDRLGIAVCRCPECGRFHPAGSGVTTNSVWLRRFATLLLFVWVCAALGVTVLGLLAAAGVSSGSIGPYTDWRTVSLSGKPVVNKLVNGVNIWVEEGTDTPVNGRLRTIFTMRPFLTLHNADGELDLVAPIVCALSVFLGFLAGTLYVTLLWHWPRIRYFWCLLLPLAPAAFLIFAFGQSSEYEYIRGEVFARIAGQTGLQCVGILLGIVVGRNVSRTLVRMFVPPKARQLLAFLWQVDGKTIPAAMQPSR